MRTEVMADLGVNRYEAIIMHSHCCGRHGYRDDYRLVKPLNAPFGEAPKDTLVWVDRLLRDGWCGYWEHTILALSLGATDKFVLLTVSGQVRDRWMCLVRVVLESHSTGSNLLLSGQYCP